MPLSRRSVSQFSDDSFTVQDEGDSTKQLRFQLSGISTGQTRTLTVPDANTTIVGTDATQILTNKSVSDTFVGFRSGVNVVRINSDSNGAIDLGRQDNVASSPFIDFNTGSTTVDYDSRIIANGGTGVSGGGTLNFVAGTLSHNGVSIVTTTGAQILTNKTLSAPTFSGSYSFGGTPTWPTFNQSTTGSAATLTTSRNFQTDLASTSAVGFNGSANNTHGVTGTLPVTNGGTGRATSTVAYGLIAAGTTATGVQQTLPTGATTDILVSGGASALPVWTTATGSGAPVRATSPTLTTPNLGTPSALTLTNASGLPVSGITGSTATALGVGSLELGHASDTTLSRASAGRLAVEGVNVPTISSNDTLTNKTINGANNTITNISSSAVAGMAQIYQSIGNMIIDPSFENDASWANAWGAQSTDAARQGTKSRRLTATGAGRTTDRIILTHDGTGTPLMLPTAGDDMRYWVFAHLRKHASNTGGGTVYVTVRYIDTSGVEQIAHASDVTANSLPTGGWNRHWAHVELGTDAREIFASIELGNDIPNGDQFYVDQVAFKDVSAINLGSGTSQTLTNKTLSGASNTIYDLPTSAIDSVTDLMGSEMVLGGDFQTDSYWVNAFGAQSTDQSLISGGKSRMITSTGSGATVDRLGLLHDGTGANIGNWANQPRSHTWRVTIRKHASNVGGGNIILRTRWTDYAGSSFITTSSYAHSALSNSGFSNLVVTHTTTSSYRYFYCYVEMDNIPSGDIFYIGSASIVDNSGSVTPSATQTLSNKTLTNYTEGVGVVGTVTSSYTFDLADGNVQTVTLTASTACTFTMPTATAGKALTVFLKQAAATGNGSATFSGVKWNASGAPTITPTAGKMDILSFYADGTNWYGSFTQGFTP